MNNTILKNAVHEAMVEGSASAKIICDSIYRGSRLVTVEVEFPRPYLAEFNTHKTLSKNSASSRAMPVWKRMITVMNRPYVPNSFGVNKAGMQAEVDLSDSDKAKAIHNWLTGRDIALIQAYYLVGGSGQILKDSKNHLDLGLKRSHACCISEQVLPHICKAFPHQGGFLNP